MVHYNEAQYNTEILRPAVYPLQGEWRDTEDRDHHQNCFTLNLRAQTPDELCNVYQLEPPQITIPHELIHTGAERLGNNYFDGTIARRERIASQQYRNQTTGQTYPRDLITRDRDITSHEGNSIIYVEPFSLGNEPQRQRETYIGSYNFVRELGDLEKIQGRESGRLVYSDGAHIYFPHVTQELWVRDYAQVGFFIASYKENRRLNFISQAQIPNGRLPEGHYQLLDIEEDHRGRKERWIKLGQDLQNPIEINTSLKVPSIPGIGSSAPYKAFHDGATPEVLELQNATKSIIERTRSQIIPTNTEGSLIILGPTGSGKSTLVHHLQGSLVAQRAGFAGFKLYPTRLLPGFNIGHDMAVGTKLPCLWFDNDNNIAVWNCPGFGDPRGSKEDIVNAFAINELLKGNVKILLALPESSLIDERGTRFFKLLNEITEAFSGDNQLAQNLSLVITHKSTDTGDLHEGIRELHEANSPLLTPAASTLLRILTENPTRFAAFPKPSQEGPFERGRNQIRGSIRASQYVRDPMVNIRVSPEGTLLVGAFGERLNNYLTEYMKTESAQRIISYCNKLIDGHSGTLSSLRQNFSNFVTTLQALNNVSSNSPGRFVEVLRPFINVDDISQAIDLLGFLKKIKNDIAYQTEHWSSSVRETIAKINQLVPVPLWGYDNQLKLLSIKGPLISTGDINAALRQHPNPIRIQVYGLNEIVVDEDITSQGTSVFMIAPSWKVIGTRSLTLSGVNGTQGTDGAHGTGQDGQPGGNGGNFYGKGFTFSGLERFTVLSNGGQGGRGGNGADGGDPARELLLLKTISAEDIMMKMREVGRYYHPTSPPSLSKCGNREISTIESLIQYPNHVYIYYESSPYNPAPGGDGGCGGVGGVAGHAGLCVIDPYFTCFADNHDGIAGTNGSPGVGGQGGKNGKEVLKATVEQWDMSSKDKAIGYPYGTIPRLLLFWITTEAVRTRSRKLELGDSLSEFMKAIGLNYYSGGGKRGDIKRLQNQMERLLRANISLDIVKKDGKVTGKRWIDMQVAPEGELWWSIKNPNQPSLLCSWIELSDKFYDAIVSAPVPADMRILKALKRSPLALDIYAWATYTAYRTQQTGNARSLSWELLHEQFGAEYKDTKNFSKKAWRALLKVQALYPELAVERVPGGLKILPSKPSISVKSKNIKKIR